MKVQLEEQRSAYSVTYDLDNAEALLPTDERLLMISDEPGNQERFPISHNRRN